MDIAACASFALCTFALAASQGGQTASYITAECLGAFGLPCVRTRSSGRLRATASVRQIGEDGPRVAVAKVRQQRRVARQPVELGDNQARSAELGSGDGALQFGPVVALAALDLDDLGECLASLSGC